MSLRTTIALGTLTTLLALLALLPACSADPPPPELVTREIPIDLPEGAESAPVAPAPEAVTPPPPSEADIDGLLDAEASAAWLPTSEHPPRLATLPQPFRISEWRVLRWGEDFLVVADDSYSFYLGESRVALLATDGRVLWPARADDLAETPMVRWTLVDEQDVTRDGLPDIHLAGFEGGAYCCTTYVLIASQAPRRPQVFYQGYSGTQRFTTGSDGRKALRLLDTSLANAYNAPILLTPVTAVPVVFDGTRFVRDLAHQQLADEPDLDAERELAADLASDCRYSTCPDSLAALAGLLQSYLYTGRVKTALGLLDRTWPQDAPGRDTFLRTFVEHLEASPNREAVEHFLGTSLQQLLLGDE